MPFAAGGGDGVCVCVCVCVCYECMYVCVRVCVAAYRLHGRESNSSSMSDVV